MNFFHTIVLGIIEGITEFLPISSTGHLILAADIMKIADSEFLKSFEVAIQLGAVLAALWLYWKKLVTNQHLFKKVVVAFIPTAVVGLVAYKFIKAYLLGSTEVVLWALFIGGVIIWVFEKWVSYRDKNQNGTNSHLPARTPSDLHNMSYKQALGIGLAQSVAVIPGVSRAAATIIGGLVAGLDRKSVVEFSFLLAIPTMAAATGLDLLKTGTDFSSHEFTMLGVGFAVSFITAMFAVKWLLKYVQTHDFMSFGIYRIAIAIIFLLVL